MNKDDEPTFAVSSALSDVRDDQQQQNANGQGVGETHNQGAFMHASATPQRNHRPESVMASDTQAGIGAGVNRVVFHTETTPARNSSSAYYAPSGGLQQLPAPSNVQNFGQASTPSVPRTQTFTSLPNSTPSQMNSNATPIRPVLPTMSAVESHSNYIPNHLTPSLSTNSFVAVNRSHTETPLSQSSRINHHHSLQLQQLQMQQQHQGQIHQQQYHQQQYQQQQPQQHIYQNYNQQQQQQQQQAYYLNHPNFQQNRPLYQSSPYAHPPQQFYEGQQAHEEPAMPPLNSLADLLASPEHQLYSPAFVYEGFGDIAVILALGSEQLWRLMLRQVGRRSQALGVSLLSQHETQILAHLKAEAFRRKNIKDPVESRKLMQQELARTRKLQRQIYTRQQQHQQRQSAQHKSGMFGIQDPNHPSNTSTKTESGELSLDEIMSLQAQYGVENGYAIAFAIEEARQQQGKSSAHFFTSPELNTNESRGRHISNTHSEFDFAAGDSHIPHDGNYDKTLSTVQTQQSTGSKLESVPDHLLDLSNPAHLQELQERQWRRQQQQMKLQSQSHYGGSGGGNASMALLAQGCNCCDFHWLCCLLLAIIFLLCSLGLWGLHHSLAATASSSKQSAWTFVMVLYIIGFIAAGICFILMIFACFTKPGEHPCARCYDSWCGRSETTCFACCATAATCCSCFDTPTSCSCFSCSNPCSDGGDCCCCYCIPGGRCCDPTVPRATEVVPNCCAMMCTCCTCRSCCSCGFGYCFQQALVQMCPPPGSCDCSCTGCHCLNCDLGCCDTCYRIICCKFRIQF